MPLGVAGRAYAAVATVAGLAFVTLAVRGVSRAGARSARDLFLATLLHLVVLFAALLALPR